MHHDAELVAQHAVVFFLVLQSSFIALLGVGGCNKSHLAQGYASVFSRARTDATFGEM